MDTAKAANLFANYPKADLYDFINAPIGKGIPIDKKLSPLIASTCQTPQRRAICRRQSLQLIHSPHDRCELCQMRYRGCRPR